MVWESEAVSAGAARAEPGSTAASPPLAGVSGCSRSVAGRGGPLTRRSPWLLLRPVILAAFVLGMVTFGFGLLNVPGIVMSIFIGLLLIAVIALPRLARLASRRLRSR